MRSLLRAMGQLARGGGRRATPCLSSPCSLSRVALASSSLGTFDVSWAVCAVRGAGVAAVKLSAGGLCNAVPGIRSPEPRPAAFVINNRLAKKPQENQSKCQRSNCYFKE